MKGLLSLLRKGEALSRFLAGSGQTVSGVASLLSLSPKTVSTYRARLLQKMHLKTNSELTHYAVKHELVE